MNQLNNFILLEGYSLIDRKLIKNEKVIVNDLFAKEVTLNVDYLGIEDGLHLYKCEDKVPGVNNTDVLYLGTESIDSATVYRYLF